MLGRTHRKIGIATTFAILKPITVPACLGALAAGSIGGTICDIDILFRDHPADDEEPERDDQYDGEWEDFALNLILFLLFIVVDKYFGGGAVDWFFRHLGFHTIAMGAVFALIVVCGMFAPHRAFMHSLFAGIALSGCIYIICAPLAPGFAIGFASHILLDLLNKTGICLFWPIKKRFKLNVCSSNKTADAVISTVAEIMCDLLVSFFLIISIIHYNQNTNIFEMMSASYSDRLTNLGAWLVFINVLTFIVERLNFSLWYNGMFPYQNHDEFFDKEKDDITADFMQSNIYILFVLGGAIGGLLSYITIGLRRKKYIENGTLGIVVPSFGAVCVAIEWACLYTIIINPVYITSWLRENVRGFNIICLVGYIVLINILAFIIYSNDRKRMDRFTVKVFFELLIAFIGGAAGSLLAMRLKGFLCNQSPIRSDISKTLQTHCLMITTAIVILLPVL